MADTPLPENTPVVVPLASFPDDDALFVLSDALEDAQDARLHLGALLEVLSGCHPAYKIEAGLYVGNLRPILERLQRVIIALEAVIEPD